MSTIIYDSPIFGPVKSRRLGISLGINLMPNDERYVHSIAFIVNVDSIKTIEQSRLSLLVKRLQLSLKLS